MKTIYWAVDDSVSTEKSWNIIYEDPVNLYESKKNQADRKEKDGFFRCPSFVDSTKNVFVVTNPLHSRLIIEGDQVTPISKTYVNSVVDHEPSISGNLLFTYGLRFFFFCQTPTSMTVTSPYFDKAEHLKYGAVVPGKIDIGSWFRGVHLEFNLWDGVNEIEIKEGEPIAYFGFEAQENVVLRRFTMNDLLYRVANTNAESSSWEPKVPLYKRYQRFMRSRTNELVLREITQNLFTSKKGLAGE
jgi:hypothetical protein